MNKKTRNTISLISAVLVAGLVSAYISAQAANDGQD